jgi:hypothetical protein
MSLFAEHFLGSGYLFTELCGRRWIHIRVHYNIKPLFIQTWVLLFAHEHFIKFYTILFSLTTDCLLDFQLPIFRLDHVVLLALKSRLVSIHRPLPIFNEKFLNWVLLLWVSLVLYLATVGQIWPRIPLGGLICYFCVLGCSHLWNIEIQKVWSLPLMS